MGRVLRFAAILFGWLCVVAVGLAIWLHFYPSRGNVAIYLTGLVPYTIVFAILAAIIFIALRRWLMLAAAVAVTVGLCATQAPLWVAVTPVAGERFTVMSANLLFGRADIGRLADEVERSRAAVLSLQEVTPETLDAVRASAIARALPYEYAQPGPQAEGTALFSRAPLTDQRPVDPAMILQNLSATTTVPGATQTRILAVHPGAPTPGNADVWVRDIETLRDRMRELPSGPAIVAGDFNASWDQVRYRRLLENGFADVAGQVGAGIAPTFPTDLPGGRPLTGIDRIIVRGFVAVDWATFDLPGSDHRGVRATLVAGDRAR